MFFKTSLYFLGAYNEEQIIREKVYNQRKLVGRIDFVHRKESQRFEINEVFWDCWAKHWDKSQHGSHICWVLQEAFGPISFQHRLHVCWLKEFWSFKLKLIWLTSQGIGRRHWLWIFRARWLPRQKTRHQICVQRKTNAWCRSRYARAIRKSDAPWQKRSSRLKVQELISQLFWR